MCGCVCACEENNCSGRNIQFEYSVPTTIDCLI